MRKPLMLVYTKRTQTSYGVFGVFVCENDKGDKILQSMENPAHDEWKAANWRNTTTNRIDERGEMAKNEIADFVQRSFSKLFASSQETALEITGLEDLLYIPEDLLVDADDSDQSFGNPTGQIKEDGLSPTSDISDTPTTNENDDNSNLGSVKITEPGSSDEIDTPSDDDNVAGIGGHSKSHSRRKGGKPTAGDNYVTGSMTEDGGTYKSLLQVEFRVVAQKENGKYFHNLIIHSPCDVISGELELVTIGEQSDDAVDIIEADNGEIRDNLLTNVVLEEGKNVIKILFSDNMRHSLKLKAYENQ
jgi:hypothetical protein